MITFPVAPPAGGTEQQTTVNGTTAHARPTGESAPCVSGNDVWYKFTTPDSRRWIIFAGANASTTAAADVALYLADASGNLIPPLEGQGLTCNLDACGGKGAHIATVVEGGPRDYYIAVVTQSGAGGDFRLNFQSMPYNSGTNFGNAYNIFLSGVGTTGERVLANAPVIETACYANYGEDAYWLISCGVWIQTSLCESHGGYWKDAAHHDPVMETQNFPQAYADHWVPDWCTNDDSLCWAQGESHSDTSHGAWIGRFAPYGINVVTVSDNKASGLVYNLEYEIQQ